MLFRLEGAGRHDVTADGSWAAAEWPHGTTRNLQCLSPGCLVTCSGVGGIKPWVCLHRPRV